MATQGDGSSASPPAKTGDAEKSGWSIRNIMKCCGPWLLAQSEHASEAYARHQARLAAVEIDKESFLAEVRVLSEAREELLRKFRSTDDPVEKVRIRNDLEYVAALTRQYNVAQKASLHLPPPSAQGEQAQAEQEISPHWIDKFDELARARNESWREDLLARALAEEALSPGTVTPRALWLIGTLEEPLFRAFACLLDLSTDMGGNLIIPRVKPEISDQPIPDCWLGDGVYIGNLAYMLGDTGLLSTFGAGHQFTSGSVLTARYFESAYHVSCMEDVRVTGTIPTQLGRSVASFCERQFNPLGEQIFRAWIDRLAKMKVNVEELRSDHALAT